MSQEGRVVAESQDATTFSTIYYKGVTVIKSIL
jgi:hypothetical protein